MRYTVIVDGEAGAYGVVFPDLTGCTAMGATIDAALVNAGAAARDWVEVVEAQGRSVPPPRSIEQLRAVPEVAETLAEGGTLASVALVRGIGRPVRANMTLDAGVLAAIDATARRLGESRSRVVELLAEGGGLAALG